ncbi:hypothetical protein [Pseudonocardia broussonetiae]|uniref:Uncharacterized protein n=1 Tax=Pseudonocardia broussonetiae TaxID=2736640 RepID=A0A6M6JHM5_9PSEU|nr:hypothetical protein [Pseudonocardia broussonetiae]QJY46675.1 hypothetical protein HOP40_13300 [Pseudonocardia broussonetiae]
MTRPIWRADDIVIEPAVPGVAGYGVFVVIRGRRLALGAEQTRSLAAWLTAHAGALPPPAAPDAVRLEIDRQRAALAVRSERTDSPDFRVGLAWCDHALDAIAAAAGAPTERTTR